MKKTCISVVLLALAAPALQAGNSFEVLMTGLDNPRGLAWGPDGGIYVAEAGRGGTGTSVESGDGQTVQYGATGAVSRYLNGLQEQVITGLPSLAPQTGQTPGGGATGLHDIGFRGTDLFGVIGLGGSPSNATLLAGDSTSFAHLVQLTLGGGVQNLADIGAFEAANNPDGGVPDTNPYGLLVTPTGFLVADAGANALFSITSAGDISTLTVFPAQPNPLPFGPPFYQTVPTTVTLAPDNSYYVGNLTGFPFPPGGAKVWGIDPTTGTATVEASDLTNIIDLAFLSDGDLLVLQLTSNGLASQTGPGPGRLLRIDSKTGFRETLLEDPLFFPGGVLVGPDDTIYVSNLGVAAGAGQVLVIVPEAGAGGLLTASLALLAWRTTSRRRK